MKKPNFFIIGAPKCGTTSMAAWLASHPHIYMSPVKEPNFFNTDDRYTVTRSLDEYEALFAKAREEHWVVGEASVWYLFSREAVPNILAYNPEAKFMVMVRNPIEMAYALHEQEYFSGNEHIKDFRQAWHLQRERARGRKVSRFCVEPRRLLYGPVCKVGEQLERLYQLVPRERVLVILLDDVKENPRREYLKVLKFLGLPDDGRRDFPILNPAKEHRSLIIGRIVNILGRNIGHWKRTFGIQRDLGILNSIAKINTRQRQRPPMDRETRNMLREYFREDVQKLSKLLDRDLSYWLEEG